MGDITKDFRISDLPGVKSTSTSLSFSESLDKEVWLEVGKRILTAHSTVQWWIGDWLNEGEVFYLGSGGDTFHFEQPDGTIYHRVHMGEDVRSPETEAINLVPGYSRDTLLEFKRVARIFEPPIRIGELRWGHHQVAAALPTPEVRQDALETALRTKLSVSKFRNFVRRFYPNGTYTPNPDWRSARDSISAPTTESAVSEALELVDDLTDKLLTDAEAFLHNLIEVLQKRLAEVLFDKEG